MKKIEYKKVMVSMKELINMGDEYLNKMGNDGWDLIQIIPSVNIVRPEEKGHHAFIFFKREKSA